MASHGGGNFGIRVTWKTRNRQDEFWSTTEEAREADYKTFNGKPEVKSLTRIKR